MTKDSAYKPPTSSKGDVAHTAARAVISSIPLVGGPVLEFFNLLLAPSLEKRRQKWMEDVAAALHKLEEADRIIIENLRANETFVTTVMQASQGAIRTHQEEKLNALRNAILNSALPNPPDESLQLMFLSFVDVFTIWHLKILELFRGPSRWGILHNHQFPDHSMGSLARILEEAFPEMVNRRSFYDQVWRDLLSRGLTNTDSLHGMMSGGGLMAERTSELGNTFLKFISDPT